METGCIQLNRLYDYVANDLAGDALHQNGTEGRAFGDLAKKIVEPIQKKQGLYLWGKYDSNGVWHNIYIGQAGSGHTTSLQGRVLEELKFEKEFLWRDTLDEKTLLAIGEKHYPAKWHSYEKNWKRSIRRVGTTHIIWVTAPGKSDEQVLQIEANLIIAMKPTANVSGKLRVKHYPKFHDYAVNVQREFTKHIDNNRG